MFCTCSVLLYARYERYSLCGAATDQKVRGSNPLSRATVCYEYEPDYVVVDGVRVYSDGTVVSDDDNPVFVDSDGTNYYTDGTVITPDCAPGYYWVNGVLVYGG